jgi:nicotinamidase-related amidase
LTDTRWLVVIDMQEVFGRPGGDWFTPGYPAIEPTVVKLVERFAERTVFTRFVAPETPTGSWVEYYEQWPFALVPHDDPIYDLMPAFRDRPGHVISRTTFGKWDAGLAAMLGPSPEIVLAGVSTDCCVISTALAAADAGAKVRVVADACAGLTDLDHQRALDAMALYTPLIEITTFAEL